MIHLLVEDVADAVTAAAGCGKQVCQIHRGENATRQAAGHAGEKSNRRHLRDGVGSPLSNGVSLGDRLQALRRNKGSRVGSGVDRLGNDFKG